MRAGLERRGDREGRGERSTVRRCEHLPAQAREGSRRAAVPPCAAARRARGGDRARRPVSGEPSAPPSPCGPGRGGHPTPAVRRSAPRAGPGRRRSAFRAPSGVAPGASRRGSMRYRSRFPAMRARWARRASAGASTRAIQADTVPACFRIRRASASPKVSSPASGSARERRRDRGPAAATKRSAARDRSAARPAPPSLWAIHPMAGRCAAESSPAVPAIQERSTSASRASPVARATRRSRRRSLSRTARPRTLLHERRAERSRRMETRKSWRAPASAPSASRGARAQASRSSASRTARAPSDAGWSRSSGRWAMACPGS